ncbi:hypothetical protein CVT24_002234 [Panaeolus cyanescens]|uniref:Uncharacterized protein n=1 Tax=Panaeolus cyanescens TaxID=181874 RepID=A0A409YIK3_9AGAR|nr:hypothetical protein CVT24_002234 [Panaeolus cyanescens]
MSEENTRITDCFAGLGIVEKVQSIWRRDKGDRRELHTRLPTQVASTSPLKPESPTPSPHRPVLPVELWIDILQRICKNTLKEYLDQDRHVFSSNPDLYLTPLTLSHVCQYWRQVIVSHPLFWSNIVVLIGHKSSEFLLETWLARSDATMLSIWVHVPHLFDAKIFFRCIHTLHSHSRRWKAISFSLGDSAVQLWKTIFITIESHGEEIVRTWKPLELPALTDLEVISLGYRYPGKEFEFISAVCSTAKLQSVRIRCLGNALDYHASSLGEYEPKASTISSLTSLTLTQVRMPSVKTLIADLSKTVNLRALEIHSPLPPFATFASDDTSAPWNHRYLRTQLDRITNLSVTLSIGHTHWISTFFQSISLPSLQDLSVSYTGYSVSVHEMIEASSCNIRKLRLQITEKDIQKATTFLACSPSFDHLVDMAIETVHYSHQDTASGQDDASLSRFQDFIADLSKEPLLFPRLEKIMLIKCRIADGFLSQLARFRLRNSRLSYLHVQVDKRIDDHPTDSAVFRELFKSGFHAYIIPSFGRNMSFYA